MKKLEVGEQGVADKDFAGFGWLLLDCAFKVVIAVFLVSWKVLDVVEGVLAFLGGNYFQSWVLVLLEFDDLLVGFDEVESGLGGCDNEL